MWVEAKSRLAVSMDDDENKNKFLELPYTPAYKANNFILKRRSQNPIRRYDNTF